MMAVASPPSFQQINRSAWGANGGQGGLNSMNSDEVARMYMPRKSAQRANSSSSVSSNSSTSSASSTSSGATISQGTAPANGTVTGMDLNGWSAAAARKKGQRNVPWPANKTEPVSGITTTRPHSILTTNGASAASSMNNIHQPSPVVSSTQHALQSPTQQQNGGRVAAQANGEGNPVLYLLSMNGTFERKTITVPYYPESLRIGRQTNAKTVPTPINGFFDSKVLSRQHAEIWAERNGKVWIRDVKSSNGTFVNGTRLSAENRDSEPHELQSQDHLELGIDIVSEDQKTVVHHKVAAKVEHSGFLGATTNVLDMNFGDLDPTNGALMMPSQGQVQMRGRTGSQSSTTSNGRMVPQGLMTGGNTGPQQRMNFWLNPVTTEQIVKKLSHEMRTARLQNNDLGRTGQFLGTMLSKDEIKDLERKNSIEHGKTNGASVSFRMEGKPRFSDPPAPPPQQPLPEKPDVARSSTFESPSLKRSSTERPKSGAGASPIKEHSNSQIVTLAEALASARKELEAQSSRMRDLEEMLQREREARASAEGLARRLEEQSSASKVNGLSEDLDEGSIIEEAFEPPLEVSSVLDEGTPDIRSIEDESESVEGSTTKLRQRLDMMFLEMTEMKQQMESYRQRAETAETERNADRRSLADMVAKIRSDEEGKLQNHSQRPPSSSSKKPREPDMTLTNPSIDDPSPSLAPLLHKAALQSANDSESIKMHRDGLAMSMSRSPGSQSQLLYQSTPYASMLGVVIIGMGLMAYLNGWQKVEQ